MNYLQNMLEATASPLAEMHKVTDTALAAAAQLKEDRLREILDRHMGRYSLDDVRRRCRFEKVPGDPDDRLIVDGRWVASFAPFRVRTTKEDDRFVMRITQDVRTFSQPPRGNDDAGKTA